MDNEELFFKAETGNDARIKRSYTKLFSSKPVVSSEEAEGGSLPRPGTKDEHGNWREDE